jgi:hypothetical protein
MKFYESLYRGILGFMLMYFHFVFVYYGTIIVYGLSDFF